MKEWESPYACFANNPIWFADPDGLDTIPSSQVDMKTFDTEKDVVQLDEVVIKPTTEPVPSSPPSTTSMPMPAAASTQEGSKPSIGNTYDGQAVANYTLGVTGKYLRGSYGAFKDVRPIVYNPTMGSTHFDCTGWLSYVFNKMGYSEFSKASAGATSGVEVYARKNCGIRKSDPRVGDVAIWNGHVEIVVGVNGQAFKTSGSSGRGGAPIPSTKSFPGFNDPHLKYYGSGTFLGFWTPQVPQPRLKTPKG